MNEQIQNPSLKTGLEIYISRAISMVSTLIIAIVIFIISFMLLIFPLITSFYFAVSQSKREEYLIDLNNVLRTISFFFKGIKHYFFHSYILGFLGLIPPIILILLPVFILEYGGKDYLMLCLTLQIMWLPAFFLFGSVLLYGYPFLLVSNSGFQSFRYAISKGKSHKLLVVAIGFIILFPIPGILFHLLMVFSYPILAACAVSRTADTDAILVKLPERERLEKQRPGLYFILVTIFLTGLYFTYKIWSVPGVFGWLALTLAFCIFAKFISLKIALIVFGFALFFIGMLIGGIILITRQWGETAAIIWTVACILVFTIFQKRISIFLMKRDDGQVEKSLVSSVDTVEATFEKKPSGLLVLLGFVGIIALMLILIALFGEVLGGIIWVSLIMLVPVFLLSKK
ncbi:hypothetical protein ACFL0Q_04770 [Thermodesulfobacteriota bacterium]